MEIKLEIGENLGQTIETLIRNSGGDAGMQIQDAFKIDFTKLIKEHSEAGDVRLEIKDTPTPGYEELKRILYSFIGAESGTFSDGEIATLIIIARGIYWRSDLSQKILLFGKEIEKKLND